jgi:hypothetical protein
MSRPLHGGARILASTVLGSRVFALFAGIAKPSPGVPFSHRIVCLAP